MALYWVQLAVFVLPLVTLPYLARVLGPEGLGPVVVAQSFAMLLGTFLEYGFNLSATRDVARQRESPRQLALTVSDVLGAKLLLVGLSVIPVAAALAVPSLRSSPDLLLLAWVAAVSQGLYPLWYFQGTERLRVPAVLELTGRGLTAVFILLLVREADEGWKVLALQAATGVAGSAIALRLMYREVPAIRPELARAVGALRRGWHLFISSGAVTLFTSANVIVLGLFASAAQVAYFGAAEKLTRAAVRLMSPVSQAVYPRMSSLLARDAAARARQLARLTLAVLLVLSGTAAALMIVLAPTLVSVLFGEGFEGSVAVLRILALMVPLVALSGVLGLQWMLPMGMDRAFTRVLIAAGLVNLGLAVALAPAFGAAGMAAAVVGAELLVVVAMTIAIRRGGGIAQPLAAVARAPADITPGPPQASRP